jgi:hypothetical protein
MTQAVTGDISWTRINKVNIALAPASSSIRNSICTTLMALIHHFVRPLMGFQYTDRWPSASWELLLCVRHINNEEPAAARKILTQDVG